MEKKLRVGILGATGMVEMCIRDRDYLGQAVFFLAAQGVDQLQHIRIYSVKTGVQADDGTEDGNGHAGDDDRLHVGAQPYDQEGSQR